MVKINTLFSFYLALFLFLLYVLTILKVGNVYQQETLGIEVFVDLLLLHAGKSLRAITPDHK